MDLGPNPLPPVQDSAVSVGVDPFITLPPSAEDEPPARVQQLALVPGQNDAIAALDTRGLVWLIEDGVIRETPLADLRGQIDFVEPGAEAGLRSLAFHSDYATPGAPGEGRLYLAFSARPETAPSATPLFEVPGRAAQFHDVVAEFTVDPADPIVDPGTARELLRIAQPLGNHNFGQLAFDHDLEPGEPGYGLLFMGIGDGGGTNNVLGTARDLSLIHGKVARIDPLGGPDGAPYAIPDDNPFADAVQALPELYAYGFRNPQALSFDNGLLFASDIGQNRVEEINLVLRGADHGWSIREGTFEADDGAITRLPSDDPITLQYPITQYDHDEIGGLSAAVGGGIVYGGDGVPGLDDHYVFTDFPTGRLFALPLEGLEQTLADGRVAPNETVAPLNLQVVDGTGELTSFREFSATGSGRVDLRLAEGPDGEILAFSKASGTIFTLARAIGTGLTSEEAQTVAYLYEAALDRDGEIDLPGLNFWIDAREDGLSALHLADLFLESDEFEARFGDVDTLSDGDFIDLLYDNVLGRAGDAPGVAFWTAVAGQSGTERAELLLAFATSNENTDARAFVETLNETAPGDWSFVG
ncbi:MAG: PQQ-dependent sugar dehydrogenase [Pseudomonadota bacterium]